MPGPVSDGALETVVIPRTHRLAEDFEVRRALPSRQRRMVGPFVFLDQMGPQLLLRGDGLDVQPIPILVWLPSLISTRASCYTGTV